MPKRSTAFFSAALASASASATPPIASTSNPKKSKKSKKRDRTSSMGTTELELDSEAHSHKKTRRNELKVKDEVEQVQGTSSKGEPVGKLTRDAKGKGKAVEENEDVTRLRKELTLKNDIISSFRSTLSCTICLELLQSPHALMCGHVFCRECLLNWFHRPDIRGEDNEEVVEEESEDDQAVGADAETSEGDVIIVEPIVISSSSSESDSDSEIEEIRRAPAGMTNRVKADEVKGSLEGQKFTISGGDRVKVWSTMESAMERMAEDLAGGGGATFSTLAAGRAIANAVAPMDSMRAARLARFEGTGGTSTERRAAVTGAAGPNLLSTNIEKSPPPPPPIARARPAPIGEHRIANLVCPQCRDPVSQGPYRIFVLSELAVLLQTSPSESSESKPSETLPPGMMENDMSWGGLFNREGEETSEARRDRRAPVRDSEDGVSRCGHCNWELDNSGTCEGCGREFDLSDGSEGDHDSFDGGDRETAGEGFPMAPGYIYDDARSVDSRSELSSEDSFVVRDTPDKVRILNRNRRLGVADRFAGGIDRLPDDSGTEFGSNSDGGEGIQGLNRILDSEEEISDEESSAIATQEVETREDLDSDSDSSSSPPPEVTKRRKMVIIESDSE